MATCFPLLDISRYHCVCSFPHRTILLSVISLLNEPNISSAANVDASVLYRKWRESRGKDKQFVEVIKYGILMCFDELYLY